jgi:hypothetical protein
MVQPRYLAAMATDGTAREAAPLTVNPLRAAVAEGTVDTGFERP